MYLYVPPSHSHAHAHSFTELREMRVHEVVVSESHVVILTESGRVCRIRYTEETTPPQNVTTPSTGREKR